MGEIAELHVMAFEAGLDPNEMDGADWAEFLESESESAFPPSPWLIWHEVGSFVSWLNDQAEEDDDTAAGVLAAYFPELAEPEAVLSALQSIAAHTDPEGA